MLDAKLRPLIDPPLNAIARYLVTLGVRANHITIAGFAIGLLSVPLLALGDYNGALACIVINRVADGLDGAVARICGATDFGGFLDIVLDFIFYSSVVFGFAIAQPANAIYAAFLIFSFIGTSASFLAFAALAAKHGMTTEIRGQKSIYYLGGLTEGFETLVVLSLMCITPNWFWLIGLIFGIMCWITTASRIAWARQALTAKE